MAIDWNVPRKGVFRFRRVDYASRHETEALTTILPGGSITRNIDSDLKESGSLPVAGPLSLGDDLVRIYYVVEDDTGAEASIPLATMHASRESSRYTAAAQTSTLKLYSALLTLKQAKLTESLTIEAGSVAVTEAAAICASLGLPTVATPSSKALTSDASWNAGDTSYLKVVNYLLSFAGYWSALIDGWGRVVMTPYEDPADRAPVWDFESGRNCIFLPDVTVENDGFDVPNVCVLTCSNAEGTLSGSYTNDDPASPYSTDPSCRGREITLTETVDDAVDEADLNARAKTRLITVTGATEIVTYQHAYSPVTIGDVSRLWWNTHQIRMRGSIKSQEITLTPSALTTTTAKRIWE